MKLLNGLDIAEYIQERQAKQVRALRQSNGVVPKLIVIRMDSSPASDSFVELYEIYANNISIDLEIINADQSHVVAQIENLNTVSTVHGIYLHLPLLENQLLDDILNAVEPQKDVAGLCKKTNFDAPATLAIDWLLAAYNVELKGKNIVIVGQDRQISLPLAKRWQTSGLEVVSVNSDAQNISELTRTADVLVSSTGIARLIKPDMVKPTAVIVDAGFATDKNGLVGDVTQEVRQLSDIKITPEKDGLLPLVVCALLDNVIRSAQLTVKL